jgi:hypothetical protein
MSKKLYPTDTLKRAHAILTAWNHIDPSLAFGRLTFESFSADVETALTLQQQIIGLQKQLLAMRNQRDAVHIDIWSKVKRARAGIKASYGDDSIQYEIAGGTRLSERKKPRRKSLPVFVEQ